MSKSLLVSSETSPSTCSAGEEVEITYSYWDGSGHRRHVKVCASQAPAQLCDGSEPGNGTNSLPVCSTPSSFIINTSLDAEGQHDLPVPTALSGESAQGIL